MGSSQETVASISIPYIKGDSDGQLNNALAQAIASSGQFDYVQNGGEYLLDVAITSDGDSRIGYRYDRNPTSGKRRKNIVGTENRRTLVAEVKLIDNQTQETLIGPQVVKGYSEYDYVDSNSIRDLTFINSDGEPETVLDFSLGQLDSIEGAHDDSSIVAYRHLAQKIVDGIVIKSLCDSAKRKGK